MNILDELIRSIHADENPQKQIELIEGLSKEFSVENNTLDNLMARIHNLESHEEFNISLGEYEKILKEKNVEENMRELFSKDISSIKDLLKKLKVATETGNKTEQNALCNQIQERMDRITRESMLIEQYFKDMSSLRYSKKYIRGIRIFSKFAKGILFRMQVSGLENIPSGACIIAPHHVNSIWDPLILNAVMPRKLFYLGAVEPFAMSKPYGKLYYKLGVQPFKRTDKSFGKVIEGRPSEEFLHSFSSSNRETILNIIKYLRYGEAVVIFPEGDTRLFGRYIRENNEEFVKLQPGWITIAQTASNIYNKDIPVIPVGIHYSSDGLFKLGAFTRVTINVGRPIVISQNLEFNNQQRDMIINRYNETLYEAIKSLTIPQQQAYNPKLAPAQQSL